MTPHLGANSHENLTRIGTEIIEILNNYIHQTLIKGA